MANRFIFSRAHGKTLKSKTVKRRGFDKVKNPVFMIDPKDNSKYLPETIDPTRVKVYGKVYLRSDCLQFMIHRGISCSDPEYRKELNSRVTLASHLSFFWYVCTQFELTDPKFSSREHYDTRYIEYLKRFYDLFQCFETYVKSPKSYIPNDTLESQIFLHCTSLTERKIVHDIIEKLETCEVADERVHIQELSKFIMALLLKYPIREFQWSWLNFVEDYSPQGLTILKSDRDVSHVKYSDVTKYKKYLNRRDRRRERKNELRSDSRCNRRQKKLLCHNIMTRGEDEVTTPWRNGKSRF